MIWQLSLQIQKKFWGSNGIRTHALRDTGAMPATNSLRRIRTKPRGLVRMRRRLATKWAIRILVGSRSKCEFNLYPWYEENDIMCNCLSYFITVRITFTCSSALVWSLSHTHNVILFKVTGIIWTRTWTSLEHTTYKNVITSEIRE